MPPLVKDNPAPVCKACNGTGVSSKGNPCWPCQQRRRAQMQKDKGARP